jgi:hypothetical protein
MSRLRRHRLLTVAVALCSLLFMQFAVAAYSCPGFQGRVAEISAMAQAGMPCAGSMDMSMDKEQPALCSAHCQTSQSICGDPALDVPSLPAIGITHFHPLAAALPAAGDIPEAPLLARATPPPIALRHCCLRI